MRINLESWSNSSSDLKRAPNWLGTRFCWLRTQFCWFKTHFRWDTSKSHRWPTWGRPCRCQSARSWQQWASGRSIPFLLWSWRSCGCVVSKTGRFGFKTDQNEMFGVAVVTWCARTTLRRRKPSVQHLVQFLSVLNRDSNRLSVISLERSFLSVLPGRLLEGGCWGSPQDPPDPRTPPQRLQNTLLRDRQDRPTDRQTDRQTDVASIRTKVWPM